MLWQSPQSNDSPAGASVPKTSGRNSAGIWLMTFALWAVLAGLSVALWWTDLSDRTLPSLAPIFVLCGGLAISVFMPLAVLQMLLTQARREEQTQRHLEAIESLNAISTAISGQIGSGTALHELAAAAGRLLAMERSGVCLLDEAHRTLEVVAAAGDMPEKFPTLFRLDQLPACDYSIRTNSVVFEDDIRTVTRPYSLETVRMFGVVSMILIPLQIEGRPIGLLTFSSSHPNRFTYLDRRIAELLGSQASVILSKDRLIDQTRRDALAKTTLLRELNHRVKNNLTGIVTLLELNVPKMPPEVRKWLDRATDRIRAMAGAHQLFTGGMESVGLEELVVQTLSALSVSKPPNVTVRTDLDEVRVSLDTEQAVGLAMVLHELCFNAMVHGLRDGGVLTIRAHKSNGTVAAGQPGGIVVIDVIDDGVGCWHARVPESDHLAPLVERCDISGTGHGLELVGGLVKRELRGKFLIRPGDEGGTVATVEFPLGGDER
jgi:two-component sensor histidine kinase